MCMYQIQCRTRSLYMYMFVDPAVAGLLERSNLSVLQVQLNRIKQRIIPAHRTNRGPSVLHNHNVYCLFPPALTVVFCLVYTMFGWHFCSNLFTLFMSMLDYQICLSVYFLSENHHLDRNIQIQTKKISKKGALKRISVAVAPSHPLKLCELCSFSSAL